MRLGRLLCHWPRRGERLCRGGEVVSQSCRAELRHGPKQSGPLLRRWQRRGERLYRGGEVVSQICRTELRHGSIQPGRLLSPWLWRGQGLCRGLQVVFAGGWAGQWECKEKHGRSRESVEPGARFRGTKTRSQC